MAAGLMLAAACATSADPAAPTLAPEVGVTTIMVGESRLTVWVADTPEERGQGLRGVSALPEGIDGMLFTWDSPTMPSFGMRDTLIPLDIWWFAPDGSLLGMTEMDTCPGGGCVSYSAPGLVSWALETPAGVYEFERGEILTTS